MSCGCNNNSSGCPDVPYPQISRESVPSLIDNLVYALYGTINKSVTNGRVVWDIPCDPLDAPAEVTGIPREEGEGLLCYIIRVLNEDVAVIPNVMTTNANQTVTGIKTFTQNIIGSIVGDIFASDGITKVLENGTGANATFTGGVTGNVVGNLTGNAGTATALQTARTIGISGSVTGTATSFDGTANIIIPATITSGATITSPVLAGTATGSLISSVIQGVTDGSAAASGFMGQVVTSTIAVGSAVVLTTTITATVTSISLPAGEWYVNGQVDYRAAAATSITILTQGISQTIALGGQDTFSRSIMGAVVPTASNDFGIPIRGQRIVLTATTPIYLVAAATFTVAALSAYGTIEARRIR